MDMRTYRGLAAALVTATMALPLAVPAAADSTAAQCEFYGDGDLKKDRTGPCTFAQRQGYLDITLTNGKVFSLSPGKKPGVYRDQEDHKVVRKHESDKKDVFKWDQKKIVVTFP